MIEVPGEAVIILSLAAWIWWRDRSERRRDDP